MGGEALNAAATTWDHMFIVHNRATDTRVLEHHLKQLGSVGWEVVGVDSSDRQGMGPPTPGAGSGFRFASLTIILKRLSAGPPAPTDSTPSWHPDPLRRFDVRYWDGLRWTEHVLKKGLGEPDVAAIDFPLAE